VKIALAHIFWTRENSITGTHIFWTREKPPAHIFWTREITPTFFGMHVYNQQTQSSQNNDAGDNE
jgi:hypothetical protein